VKGSGATLPQSWRMQGVLKKHTAGRVSSVWSMRTTDLGLGACYGVEDPLAV
jgi:hypothetical protein